MALPVESLPLSEHTDEVTSVKILHVISDLKIGGSQSLLVKHAHQLANCYPSIDARICVLAGFKDSDKRYLGKLPTDPVPLDFSGRYRNPFDVARCILALRHQVRDFQPDIVHSYLWISDIICALALRGTGIGQVCHVLDRRLERDATRLATRLKARATGALLRNGEKRFVAVSDTCRDYAIRNLSIDPANVVTAYNGIFPEQFGGGKEGKADRRPLTIGTLSRLDEEKGHRYLIDAFARLTIQDPHTRLKIAGDGPLLTELSSAVEAAGLVSRVEILGPVESAADFYRQIDLFVIPSIFAEGLPTTILEAMASSLPVIASDVGGSTEAVRHEMDGLIVPPRDSGALADAIRTLANDREQRRQMGAAGYKRVRDDFTVSQMTRTIVENVYRPLLLEASTSGRAKAA